ncbi:hypothetical protein LMG19089_04464 [Ralstonia edaphis]|uniref:hypothetical protein n=1 Tax=Ralstonia edaphi TaxID=3058599 RepID=UPI0028F4EF21|nr:hypothetical protein [Ralstonia sp. LMG 6871]CAJ0707829.1 hypothetical protein LMG19089_04464 [Ralstonia sp. LMG 6871]
MAKDSLNLCRREGGEANSLRSNSLPSFSSLQQKFKAPSRAGYGHTVVALALVLEHTASCAVLLLRLGVLRVNFGVQNACFEVLNLDVEALNSDFGVPNLSFGVLNSDSEVLNSDFEVLNLNFEVLNFSFAVLKLRHQGSERQL